MHETPVSLGRYPSQDGNVGSIPTGDTNFSLKETAMALSNILREPRREITETVLGAILLSPLFLATYPIGNYFKSLDDSMPLFGAYLCGFAAAGALALAVFMLAIFIHYIGEEFCDYLQNNNIRLRPKQRY